MTKPKTTQSSKVAITVEGWYYLGMLAFIVAGAVIRDINLLYIMAGMMLGPLLVSWYASTKSLRRLEVSRRFPGLVSVGDPLYVEVTAGKPKGTSTAFATIVVDRVLRDGENQRAATQTRIFFPIVRPGSEVDASYRAVLNRRGQYQLGPLKVSTSMPLGLVRVTRSIADHASVLVSPRLGSLSTAWTRHLEFKNEGGQKSATRRGNSEGDFYGMREWRNGDGRNHIHWRTTAKRNKLTVRQFEKRVNQDLVVILDLCTPLLSTNHTRKPNGATSGNNADFLSTNLQEQVELAVSFAATLIVEHCRHGSTHVVAAGATRNPFEVNGMSSTVFRQELMERLALVGPREDECLPDVMADVLSKAASNARIVLVSTQARDLDDEQFETIWNKTSVRRTRRDIVQVNTASAEFADWFQSSQGPRPSASSLEDEMAANVVLDSPAPPVETPTAREQSKV